MEHMQPAESRTAQYFQVPTSKFILMSLCTFGLYEIYWHYKNWRYIKERDNSKIRPVWRSIFAPIWYYGLLADIESHGHIEYLHGQGIRALLVLLYFLEGVFLKLPDPYWLPAFLSFLALLPAVKAIERVNTPEPETVPILKLETGSTHSGWNYLAYFVGGPLLIITVLSAIYYFPSSYVVEGIRLWNKDIEYLKEKELLFEDEEILYFYSGGFVSIEDDGQFITECCVVSYWLDNEDNEFYIFDAAYEDIADISVAWATDEFDDTVVTIIDRDGNQFEVWLSAIDRKDRAFVNEMMKRWNAAK